MTQIKAKKFDVETAESHEKGLGTKRILAETNDGTVYEFEHCVVLAQFEDDAKSGMSILMHNVTAEMLLEFTKHFARATGQAIAERGGAKALGEKAKKIPDLIEAIALAEALGIDTNADIEVTEVHSEEIGNSMDFDDDL